MHCGEALASVALEFALYLLRIAAVRVRRLRNEQNQWIRRVELNAERAPLSGREALSGERTAGLRCDRCDLTPLELVQMASDEEALFALDQADCVGDARARLLLDVAPEVAFTAHNVNVEVIGAAPTAEVVAQIARNARVGNNALNEVPELALLSGAEVVEIVAESGLRKIALAADYDVRAPLMRVDNGNEMLRLEEKAVVVVVETAVLCHK